MQNFSSWEEFETYEDPRFDITGLTKAEGRLRAAVANGEGCDFSHGTKSDAEKLPPEPTDWNTPDPTRHIRADVLRFIVRQAVAKDKMTEKGTTLIGAQISGTLHLANTTIPTLCSLVSCQFEHALEIKWAEFSDNLVLTRSHLPALMAQGVTIRRSLICIGAEFTTTDGYSIDMTRAKVGNNVLLKGIKTQAGLNMMAVTINGELNCSQCEIVAQQGVALGLQEAHIKGGFFFQEVKKVKGWMTMNSAQIRDIVDDAGSWDNVEGLALDGFTYEKFYNLTEFSLQKRLKWLEKGSEFKGEFFPQPYSQLADVYKHAGHEHEAREVRVALAKRLAKRRFEELKKSDDTKRIWYRKAKGNLSFPAKWFSVPVLWLVYICSPYLRKVWLKSIDIGFDWVVGYGFKPAKSFIWLLGLAVIATVLSFLTWREGSFAPNSAPILISQDWLGFADQPNPADAWAKDGKSGKDWETFNAIAYAADIVIPIVEFGQTDAWAPSTSRGTWGKQLWWLRWVFTSLGWVVTSLGAAAITGVIRRD